MRKFILAAAALVAVSAGPAFAMEGNAVQNAMPASGFTHARTATILGSGNYNQGEGAQMQALRPASGFNGAVTAPVSTSAFRFNQGQGQG